MPIGLHGVDGEGAGRAASGGAARLHAGTAASSESPETRLPIIAAVNQKRGRHNMHSS
jgi:hypothetical protein